MFCAKTSDGAANRADLVHERRLYEAWADALAAVDALDRRLTHDGGWDKVLSDECLGCEIAVALEGIARAAERAHKRLQQLAP